MPPPTASRAREEPPAVLARCPGCRGQVQIGAEDVGHLMECPLCGEKFRAAEDGAPERRPARSRSAAGSRHDEDDDEDDDDYDDRRNRRRYREEDRDYILDSARAAIAWPANGLMWTGIVLLAIYALVSIGLMAAGAIAQDSPSGVERSDGTTMMIVSVVVALLGGAHGAAMAFGGFRMKKLRGAGWGYTGAGLGIATLVLSHPCLPTTWAAVTFGIWAIVALSKREVQDAIRINQGRSL